MIELEVNVKNEGEKAYLLQVQVDLPKGISFKQRPKECEQNRTRIRCPLANPLSEGKEVDEICTRKNIISTKCFIFIFNKTFTVI